MTPQAALFDMDGLLLDTERVGLEVFQDLLAPRQVGSEAAYELYLQVVGTSFAHTQDVVAKAVPGIDIEALGNDWSAGMTARMTDHVPLRPTVRKTVDDLAVRGVPMAVVTSTYTERARHHLEQAGLLHFFRDVIGGDRVSAAKPHPEPYLKGAAAHGLDARECVAFEDSDAGTEAAVRAGCYTWQIPDLRPNRPFPGLGEQRATTLAEAVRQSGLLS